MTASPDTPHAIERGSRLAHWLGVTNDVTRGFLAASHVPGMINMAGGLPASEILPADEVADIARDVILRYPHETLGYGPVEGLPELRDALAVRFGSKALSLTRANVLVTSSGMQGLDLIGKVLLDPGSLIAAQFPTYLGALDAWRPRSPEFRNMEIGDPGFNPDAALDQAQFGYAVPNFSNPTGRLVDLQVRQALVDAAHRKDIWLVEDDPYGTLHYDGEPLPRLIELSAQLQPTEAYFGPVIYMGTLSKEVAPGLRIGWVIAEPRMIAALAAAKQGTDMCTSGVTQRIALGAIEAGLIERLQPTIVELYRRRRDALCSALRDYLSDWFEWEVPVGGMFVWAVARDPMLDTDELVLHAARAGVRVAPSSAFDWSARNHHAIRINFTLNDAGQLVEGVRRLALGLAEMRAA